MRHVPDELQSQATEQRGLLSIAQLREAGLTREQVRWGLARRWSSPLPGVVHLHGGDLDAGARAIAALLHVGDQGAIGGPTAAALHGIKAAESQASVVHVLTPATRKARGIRWVQVHPTRVAFANTQVLEGVRVCSATRAVVDATRWSATDAQAEAIAIEGCQRRLTTVQKLLDELGRFGHAPGTSRAMAAALAAESGAWSMPELQLLRAIDTHPSLPTPWMNPALTSASGMRLITPDLWFDDVALAVMVHSKAHHSIGRDWSSTVERDSELVGCGITVLGITPHTIARNPDRALTMIFEAYQSALARPRPPVTATPTLRADVA